MKLCALCNNVVNHEEPISSTYSWKFPVHEFKNITSKKERKLAMKADKRMTT